jgi:hypothetical protein
MASVVLRAPAHSCQQSTHAEACIHASLALTQTHICFRRTIRWAGSPCPCHPTTSNATGVQPTALEFGIHFTTCCPAGQCYSHAAHCSFLAHYIVCHLLHQALLHLSPDGGLIHLTASGPSCSCSDGTSRRDDCCTTSQHAC